MPNEIQLHTANQTPIEIALGIDADGCTTARRLYEFLELDSSHYSRWCKKNILNNQFAEENTDYLRFAIEGETPTGGKLLRDDYKLTATFAKKLAMASGSPKGEEARDYFLRTEDALKLVANRRDDELTKLKAMAFDLMASNQSLQDRVDVLEQRQFQIEQNSFTNDDRREIKACLVRLEKVLEPVLPKKEKVERPPVNDPLLTEAQLDAIRVAVHKKTNEELKKYSSELAECPGLRKGAYAKISKSIYEKIRKVLGVRHTKATQSSYNKIFPIINSYIVTGNPLYN